MRISRGTPEARSRLCICQASFLKTFAMGGVPHAGPHSCSVVSDSFETLWTVACQAPLSMGFHRQEYWSGLPFPTTRDVLDSGRNPHLLSLLHSQAGSLLWRHLGSPYVSIPTCIYKTFIKFEITHFFFHLCCESFS